MPRKVLALAGLALSLAAGGVFVAIAVQAWRVKAEVDRQTEYLATRAYAAGDAAGHAIGFVGEVIDKAKVDLNETRSRVLAPAPARVNPFVQMAARQASINLTGSIERALGAVVTASDAVVVADAALDIVNEYPELEKLFGVNPEQVRQTKSALGSVSGELRQAQSILGVPVTPDGNLPTAEQLAQVDDALNMADHFRSEMARIVSVARQRVEATKKLIDLWAWRLAVGTTVLCGFGLLGQFFMARFCWRKYRGLPA